MSRVVVRKAFHLPQQLHKAHDRRDLERIPVLASAQISCSLMGERAPTGAAAVLCGCIWVAPDAVFEAKRAKCHSLGTPDSAPGVFVVVV